MERYRGIPPYAETRNYDERITAMYKKLTHPCNAQVVEPSVVTIALRRAAN